MLAGVVAAASGLPAILSLTGGGGYPVAASGLCPSGSPPTVLGVEWNCVAVLDLTELVLMLVSIGIVAYVFKDSERAELPGESAEVPITAEEWEAYQAARRPRAPDGTPPSDAEGKKP